MAKTSVYSIFALILPFVFFSCKDNEDIDGPGPVFTPISWSAVENSNPDGIDIEIFGGEVYIASEFQGGEITLEADEDVYIHQQNPKDFKWYRKTEYEDEVLSMSVQKDKVYIKLASAAASSEAQIMIVGKYDTKVGKIVLKRESLE